jgi:hypothetical protein
VLTGTCVEQLLGIVKVDVNVTRSLVSQRRRTVVSCRLVR